MYNDEYEYIELICWDNEGDGDGAVIDGDGAVIDGDVDGGGGDGGQQAALQAAQQQAGRTFTQKEVDTFVSKRNAALKNKFQTMEKNYQDLLQQQNLSGEMRAQLENDLENVQAEMRTAKEQAEYEAKRAEEQHARELKTVNEEASKYKSLFEQSTIERSITDAVSANDGFSSEQFVAYLAPKAEIVEEVDGEGNKTGELVPRIKWRVNKEDGTVEEVRKSPEEVVKLMKEDTHAYGNMFKAHVASGIGSGTSPDALARTGSRVDPTKLSTEEYMKLAKTPEGRQALGLSR